MKELKRILSFTRRAVDDYDMIADGDRIGVGISGGKDSLTLLFALAELRRFYPKKFELVAITVDMGFDGVDFSPIADLCRELDVPFVVVPTQIARVVFDVRKEKNPCGLCAKMRRGALHDECKRQGCSKLALGHHFDDVVDTFMLNLFYEGRLGSFSPVTYLSRKDLTMIRPLLYAQEKDVRYFVNRHPLPVITSPCPADKNTERESMKQLLIQLERQNKGLRHRIFGALQKAGIDGYRETKLMKFPDDDE
ncbi:MAG: tRNA 2-thiocytidine(32) synthetase TtcA [Ruminococcaceae bacterium]|nr:tRNA 2-thiocytidine(32) synthetase TtcA [Oscillospiraceae bacterium]